MASSPVQAELVGDRRRLTATGDPELARERSTIPNQTSAQVPAPAPTQPNRQSGWLLASLGVLAAVLVLAVGLAVLAARRASHRARLGQPA